MREDALRLSRGVAKVLLWPAVALVVWGELSPAAAGGIPIWDKALHFTAYFGLAGLAFVALGGGRRALWALLGLVLLGAVLEILQGVTGRDPSFNDEIANTLGVICGAGLVRAYVLLLSPRLVDAEGPD